MKQRIQDYKRPLEKELGQRRTQNEKVETAYNTAEDQAEKSYKERMGKATQTLTESGMDDKAFARVRQKNPDIDLAVRQKTLLLAAIELVPLLLKMLLRNSPISAETRANLQREAAYYRDIMRQSIQNERNGGPVGFGYPVPPPALPGHATQLISPNIVHAHWPPNETTADGFWVGYAN